LGFGRAFQRVRFPCASANFLFVSGDLRARSRDLAAVLGNSSSRSTSVDFGGLLIAARRHAPTWCLPPGKSWAKTSLDT